MFLFPFFICLFIFMVVMIQVWGKTGSKIYGPTAGLDYKDNQLRFSLLCLVSFHNYDIVSFEFE